METTSNIDSDSHKWKSTLTNFYYLALALFFAMNFFGFPAIKFFYLFFLGIFLMMIVFFKPAEVLPYFIPFAMIEGQGRVVWAYHPLLRILFDLLLLVIAFKTFYLRRKVIDTKALPYYVYLLIFFHFIWYIVQLFNPNAIGPFAVITASKIYIIPFIIFFSFIANEGLNKKVVLIKIRNLTILTIFLESILVIYQFQQGHEFIAGIHSYYTQIMGNRFTGLLYRPFGTTHLPGAYSIFFTMMTPLLFLTPIKGKKIKLALTAVIPLLLYAMFLAQVRSAFVKCLFIIIMTLLILYIRGEKKFKKLILTLSALTIVGGIASYSDISSKLGGKELQTAMARFSSIGDFDTISSARTSPSIVFDKIVTQIVEEPIGLGPGRTGAASNMFKKDIERDPVYGLDASWTHDNLYLSLAIDLGAGMIFYLIVILILPLKLINTTIRAYFKNRKNLPLLTGVTTTTLIIIIGNWGGVGLPYNPESFFFWLCIALGFKNIERLNKNEL